MEMPCLLAALAGNIDLWSAMRARGVKIRRISKRDVNLKVCKVHFLKGPNIRSQLNKFPAPRTAPGVPPLRAKFSEPDSPPVCMTDCEKKNRASISPSI